MDTSGRESFTVGLLPISDGIEMPNVRAADYGKATVSTRSHVV